MKPGTRRRASRASMLAGALLFVVGVGIRMGMVPAGGVAGQGPSEGPSVASPEPTRVPPAPSTASVAPSAAAVPAPTLKPSASPTPAPVSPAPTPETWFADDFDTVGAWPVGNLDLLKAEVSGGVYRVIAQPVDLPVVVVAGASDGWPGADLTLSADVGLAADADASSAVGLVIEDADGTRLLALVSAGGRVMLARDSMESFDVVASGSIPAPSGRIHLGLELASGRATVTIDGSPIAAATATLDPAFVGLAFWASGTRTRFEVDSYGVWSSPRDPA